MIYAVLRWGLVIVLLTAVVVICATAVVVGLLHPRLSPQRTVAWLGELNRATAAALSGG